MIYRNFMLYLLMPLVLLQEISSERLKRVATPNYDEDVYHNFAKYVVSLRSRTPHKYFGDNHFCGGTIISVLFVLTAAHCVMDNRKIMHRSRVLLVVAGTPNRLKHRLGWTLNIPVAEIFVHTNFTLYNTNNIAIIKLAEELPIMTNKHVGIIQLPNKQPTFGNMYRVMGWGRVYEGGSLASRILYIDVKLLEPSVCKSYIKSFSTEMLCAGNFNNADQDPCPGDSGDPFLEGTTLYGIATYDIGCGNVVLPSVYTNVFHHIDWINDLLAENISWKSYQQPLCILFLLNLLIYLL